uniref:Putative secreted protein n=1 Tax=Anopheles marajoara TaxID=58244 RepID=A0A2M4C9D2_9DIPT
MVEGRWWTNTVVVSVVLCGCVGMLCDVGLECPWQERNDRHTNALPFVHSFKKKKLIMNGDVGGGCVEQGGREYLSEDHDNLWRQVHKEKGLDYF